MVLGVNLLLHKFRCRSVLKLVEFDKVIISSSVMRHEIRDREWRLLKVWGADVMMSTNRSWGGLAEGNDEVVGSGWGGLAEGDGGVVCVVIDGDESGSTKLSDLDGN